MVFSRFKTNGIGLLLAAGASFILLYFIQLNNYLLFHLFAEIFSIIIAFSVFIFVWNGRSYLKDDYMLLLGIAYLFIGFIDLLHTIGYPGMNIFQDYDYYANQFWVAARGMEAVSLLVAVGFSGKKRDGSIIWIFLIYMIVTLGIIDSILLSNIFPPCFIEGEGQTEFKIAGEIVINVLLMAALLIAFFRRRSFSRDSFRNIILSIIFTIIAEIAFTFYVSNYGISNMLGHFAKIISFYFIYRALVRKNILEPYDTIFKELSEQTTRLNDANELKTRLFSIIAHDLIGPISGISGVAETLDENIDAMPVDDRKELVRELKTAAVNTSGLLDNLLSWARLELGGHRITAELYNLQLLLDEVVSTFLQSYKLKRVELVRIIENPDELEVIVDKDAFLIIIRNILSNSLKFSSPGSIVRITAASVGEYTEIRIEDQGVGMEYSPELMLKPVNESRRGTANEKGSGLGLNMIKKYTEDNNGTVEIESQPGIGTTVILRLPQKKGRPGAVL